MPLGTLAHLDTGDVPEILNAKLLTGTLTWNPASIADGAGSTSAAITVTGAALGDFAEVAVDIDLAGITATAYVSAADTVKIQLANLTGGAVDLAEADYTVKVRLNR